ncbi:hypothetical protein DCCM_4537 [Desulfocucumis palustris]|uniref:TraC-like domain-containing protein n=1 Tax=Desulfocucumis palustris TaxID=1898651 RepID=A0A2L2XGZ8_9FIRM|nr:hypothetical protein [Desulfocucumis palustris]GBF35410.1 hypothetical protein DCCM_4537 [Desulfocucumis palustris]
MLLRIKGRGKKKKGDLPAREDISSREPSTRDWLPIEDIGGGLIVRRDGWLVAVLKVEPLNIDLKSDREKKRIIKAVHEVFNGQREAFQILSIGRPVDLDGYLQELEVMVGKADAKRKRHLREYIRHVAGIVTGGEALEHRYYVLLSQEPDPQARDELLKRSYEMAAGLKTSGLKVTLCQDREIIDLMFSFMHPAQAAFERAPSSSEPELPPAVNWGVE